MAIASEFSDTMGMARGVLMDGTRRPRLVPGGDVALIVEADDGAAETYAQRVREGTSARCVRAHNLSEVADVLAENRVATAVVGSGFTGRAVVVGALTRAGAEVLDLEAAVPCPPTSVEWLARVDAAGLVTAEKRYSGFSPARAPEFEAGQLEPDSGHGVVGFRLRDACLMLSLSVMLPQGIALRNIHAEAFAADGQRLTLAVAGQSHAYRERDGLAVLTVTQPVKGVFYSIAWEHAA